MAVMENPSEKKKNVLEPVGQSQPLCTWKISQAVFIDTEGSFNYSEGISGMLCQS